MTKVRKTRYTDYERWVGLPHYMLKAPAWRSMTPNAKALLIDVWQRYNGTNNGEIGYSVREAADIGLHKNTAKAAFDHLIERGFLEVTRQAAFTTKTRESRTFRITALPVGEAAATKDFMRWVPAASAPKNRTQSLHRDRQSPNRDSERQSATILPLIVPPQGPSTPKSTISQSLHRDTSNYHGGREAHGGESAAKPVRVSEAARRSHSDGDDGKLPPIADILKNIRRQVESGIDRETAIVAAQQARWADWL
jgi:hypothetical protein